MNPSAAKAWQGGRSGLGRLDSAASGLLAKAGKVCYPNCRSVKLYGGLTKTILLAFKPCDLPLWGALGREPRPGDVRGLRTEEGNGEADMSDISERVKKIVVEHLGVEADKVTDSASFIDDLGADSLDTVELVRAFEEEFGCEIPDDAAETILTVGDAIKFLEKNTAA